MAELGDLETRMRNMIVSNRAPSSDTTAPRLGDRGAPPGLRPPNATQNGHLPAQRSGDTAHASNGHHNGDSMSHLHNAPSGRGGAFGGYNPPRAAVDPSIQNWQDFANGSSSEARDGPRSTDSQDVRQHTPKVNLPVPGASQNHRGQYGSNRGSFRSQPNDFHHRRSSQAHDLHGSQSRASVGHSFVDLRPPFRQADYVDRLAAQHIQQSSMSDHVLAENERVRLFLETFFRYTLQSIPATRDIPGNTVVLRCFGSIASGFATADSDMDVMLSFASSPENEAKHNGIPRILEKALLDKGFGARLLSKTRVPIIRFCELPSGDLHRNLLAARQDWEEETAKSLAEGKLTNKAGKGKGKVNQDDDPSAEESPPESPVETIDPSKAKDSAATNKKQKDKKEEEPRPLPYQNDKERIRLYELAMQEEWFNADQRKVIHRYMNAFKAAAGDQRNASLLEAKKALDSLPDVLSRYREPRQRNTELEYPKDGVGILCDINFSNGAHSNPLALHNTRLLYCYSLCDPRIRQMVIFVKAWAKKRKINKPYTGTLSSYGYVLMVLHFAVNVADPPLAPNLQQMHERNGFMDVPTSCKEFDIRFWQDQSAIRAAAQRPHNRQSVGSLLAQFFRFFAVNSYRGQLGFQWMRDVLSLRTPGGIISKESKGWTGATEQAKVGEDGQETSVTITSRYLCAIEDPFEHSHNVGRPVVHHGIIAIRDEFRRANQLIVSQGYWDNELMDFFAEGVEKERPYKFFGPNPKHKRPVKFGPHNLVGEARKKALEKAEKLAKKEAEENQKNLADNDGATISGDQELAEGTEKTVTPVTETNLAHDSAVGEMPEETPDAQATQAEPEASASKGNKTSRIRRYPKKPKQTTVKADTKLANGSLAENNEFGNAEVDPAKKIFARKSTQGRTSRKQFPKPTNSMTESAAGSIDDATGRADSKEQANVAETVTEKDKTPSKRRNYRRKPKQAQSIAQAPGATGAT